jgi:U3 small nucleolar RNA-associated protein 3
MGKKRNSAKTGDQALYKNRDATTASKKSQDHDAMFNEVDRYHNQKEEQFLKLDATDTASEDDDGITKTENVLDLGLADSSEEEDDDSSQDDDGQVGVDVDADDSEEEQAVSSDSDDDDEPEQADVRDWGSKKSAYYHGDTADLEIGQEEDDAYLEEEAAKEVQAARYEQMDEDDFVLSDHDDEPSANAAEQVSSTTTRDVSKLSKADKKKLLQSHHPELLPMLTHFSQVIRDYESRTKIVAKALLMDDEQGTPEVSNARSCSNNAHAS